MKNFPIALLLVVATANAQGTKADYARSNGLRTLTQGKVAKARVEAHWFDGNNRFWYVNSLLGGRNEFIVMDVRNGSKKPAFDHAKMAAALTKLGEKASADRLPIQTIELRTAEVRVLLKDKVYRLNDQTLTELNGEILAERSLPRLRRARASAEAGERTTIVFQNRTDREIKLAWVDAENNHHEYGTVAPGESFAQGTYAGHVWVALEVDGKELGAWQAASDPGNAMVDGKPFAGERSPTRATEPARRVAIIRDYNVWLQPADGGDPVQLTTDGSKADAYGGQVFTSPDNGRFVVLKTKAEQEHKVYKVESSPRDQLQPKLHTQQYLKPGDDIAVAKPHLFDATNRAEILIDDTLFPTPWEISDIRWQPDGKRFTFVYNQRGHQVLRVIAVDAATGKATAIIDETSKTFIDYAGKYFIGYLDKTNEIAWMSERDGWNHLYLYDALTGRVKNQITKGNWVVRAVDGIDEEKREVSIRLSGYYAGQDPYLIHYARVKLDGSGMTMLTDANGTHRLSPSPDGRYYVDTYSRVDLAPVSELHRASDGSLVCEIERADATALKSAGWVAPEPFVAKGRDGKTDIYGVIWRPTNLDPNRKYPVIETIYAGPQGAFVPKDWSSFYSTQQLAELGFIVVQIDGMGTSNRSKAFHDVCSKNLVDAGFPDRILWMKAAAAKYPYMDVSRVGLYGGSAGGQNALGGLLTHPEFYKAGVADCGCHDNRMDKVWWNELWMGWPIGPHYAEQSNVTLAPKLEGKLLLMVGELDTNVDPASTMQVVNALIKANKDFELLVFPGAGHGTMGSPYGWRRMSDFFVRSLLGVEPRAN